uniref:U21-Lycotoxin-Lsp1ci_1 n=1 Tax=Lycosa sp. SGP-2016 TaxID=1905177 RepID=A0A482Z9G8_9ARAC
MKVFVVVALLVTLISYSSSEGIDDLDADDFLSLMANEQPRKDCIPKHHECTSDKHGCCRGHMFKYKCQCTAVLIARTFVVLGNVRAISTAAVGASMFKYKCQ